MAKPAQRRNGLTEDQLEEIREAFNLFDSSHAGNIDLRELKAAMRALGFEIKRDELKSMMSDINKEVNDANAHLVTINVDEFIELMTPKMSSRDTRDEIEKIFRLFDEENTGFITFKQLKKVCSELGEGLTDNEIQEMIDEADRDQDGKINFEEFYRVMKKRGDNPLEDWDSDDD